MRLAGALVLTASIIPTLNGANLALKDGVLSQWFSPSAPAKGYFPELSGIDENDVKAVTLALKCSISLTMGEECEGFTAANEARNIIYFHDEKRNKLFVGYRFFLNRPRTKNFIKLVYERAEAQFAELKELFEKNCEAETFLVGYDSGAALATLHANRICSSSTFGDELNRRNRIKVVTLNELAVIGSTIKVVPLRPANHLSLFHQDDIENVKSSLKLLGSIETVHKPIGSPNALPDFSDELVAFLSVGKLNGEVNERFKLATRKSLAKAFKKSEFLLEAFPRAFERFQRENMARKRQDALEAFVTEIKTPLATSTVQVQCKSFMGDDATNLSDFVIQCDLLPANEGSPHHYATFDAVLVSRDKAQDACAALPKAEDVEGSFQCIIELAKHSPALQNALSHEECAFIPIITAASDLISGSGVIIRAKPGNFNKLSAIIDNDPAVFISLLPEGILFPEACTNVLNPSFVQLSKDRKKALNEFGSYLVELATGKNGNSRPAGRNTSKTIFKESPSQGFTALRFQTTPNFSTDDALENNLLKCFDDVSLMKPVDCNVPINRWVSGACPAFCSQDDWERRNAHVENMCSQVIKCPAAQGAFISALHVRTLLSADPTAAISGAILTNDPTYNVAQGAMYSFRPHSFRSIPWTTFAFVVWEKTPEVAQIQVDRLEILGRRKMLRRNAFCKALETSAGED